MSDWTAPTPKTTTLRDGRTLAWYDIGDPDGVPVVSNHGGLVCGLDVTTATDAATAAGVRILSPDRPGIGGSDPAPDRTLVGWSDDVADLLDDQGIDRCRVLGWSLGGDYALSCAHGLAERAERTTVIAGCLPLDDPTRRSELNKTDDRFARLAVEHPHRAERMFKVMAATAHRAAGAFVRSAARSLGGDDAEVVRRNGDWFVGASRPALSRPSGMVTEYRVMVQPWGFRADELADRTGPISVWQGTADPLVPEAWGRELARELGAELHLVEGAGHFLAVERWDQILADLLG